MRLLGEPVGFRKVDWMARHRLVNYYILEHTLAVAEVMVKLGLACLKRGTSKC